MDHHHRRSIIAFCVLAIVALIYVHRVTIAPLPVLEPYDSIPFAGQIPAPVERIKTTEKQMIFTFDGGEGAQSASQILDILAKHRVQSTFFLTGQWIQRNPELVLRMKREGHEIYNHSFSHPHLTTIDGVGIASQLRRMDEAYAALTGSSTKPYFRPPYGEYDAQVLKVAAASGYRAIMWTVDAGDWMESQGFTEAETKDRIYSHIEPGAIVLMHVGDNTTGRILDEVFTEIERRGYVLVTLGQALIGEGRIF